MSGFIPDILKSHAVFGVGEVVSERMCVCVRVLVSVCMRV